VARPSLLDQLVRLPADEVHGIELGQVEQASDFSKNMVGRLAVSNCIDTAHSDDDGTSFGGGERVEEARHHVDGHI